MRYVSASGGIPWNKRWVNLSSTCVGEYAGFEEIDDRVLNVCFGPIKLGRFHERHMLIEDDCGELKRYKV